jgi:hypothetical protein
MVQKTTIRGRGVGCTASVPRTGRPKKVELG